MRDSSGKDAPAGGPASVAATLRYASRTGLRRAVAALGQVNQPHGFDCPGCAWPDAIRGGPIEFCENGAKAVAHETTSARLEPAFFERHAIAELLARSDQWLEAQGRLCEPLVRRAGSERYEPIGWDAAFAKIAAAIQALDSPNQAVFYTSGRTSNEAAFLYQLFARELGTNNLPDCSNMCHESSGHGLSRSIGVGKGTVSIDDFALADAIFLIGQNPGTNHPRMLTTLAAARRRGCRIVAINPLRERGLVRFAHPQEVGSWLGSSQEIADLYLQVRLGGDVALLQGIMKELLALEDAAPGRVLDWDFIRRHTQGFDALRAALAERPWEALVEQSGIAREAMREVAELYARAERTIVCWAMGLTQHRHAVANVQEIANLLLLRGNVGRPGAGPCPVRGHSNVQGDRTVGITERPAAALLEALEREFGFAPPREPGLDTVAAIGAMHAGRARVFIGLGGNFAVATPDTPRVEEALRRCELTVQISTKLNRSHLVCGREALVLPCLARSERDLQASGPQLVTIEDSMSVVHTSEGRLEPASPQLRSEPAIVAGVARAVLGAASRVPWEDLAADYDRIRERIERVVPGFSRYNRRVRSPGGFVLPSGARERVFDTPSGRAVFTVNALPEVAVAPGRLSLTTIRSHDQFNTTVYSPNDRYRGISGDRRVVLMHPQDLAERGLAPGDRVDLTSHFRDETRTLRGFRTVAYDLPRGCAAAYFPEANALVSVDSYALGSRTPTYKSIEISVAASAGDATPASS